MVRRLTRRSFLALSMTSAGIAASSKWLRPAQGQTSEQYNLLAIQSGDVTTNRAVIWGRGARKSRLVVDFSTSPNFKEQVHTRTGSLVSAETDYTGTIDLQGLRPNTTYYYQVRFVDGPVEPWSGKLQGVTGRLQTAPSSEQASSVRFVWAADMAGQGWGRNPNLTIKAFDGEEIEGGYVIFDVMRKLEPDFAIFCGDMIYADNPIPLTKAIPESVGGGTWVNDPAKDFVAISLDEFRENWKYNLGDSKFARFLAETPIYVQWDDHEVTNNWYPSEILTAAPYNGLPASVLAERARQAFLEYNPIRGEEIFRSYNYGKHLDLFLLDLRTYRGRNDRNTEPTLEMMGEDQLEWIKAKLLNSKATWKVISNHDPISIVTGGPGDYDAWSQDDSRVLGRESEFSELLKFIKDEEIENVVFITADVHFPAAIYYDPSRAVFKDFNPFWEFVIGPIHAGAFGPASDLPLDPSFGPEYEFSIFPKEANLPPPNNQFFGSIEVDGQTAQLTARIHDITGKVVYEKVLNPS